MTDNEIPDVITVGVVGDAAKDSDGSDDSTYEDEGNDSDDDSDEDSDTDPGKIEGERNDNVIGRRHVSNTNTIAAVISPNTTLQDAKGNTVQVIINGQNYDPGKDTPQTLTMTPKKMRTRKTKILLIMMNLRMIIQHHQTYHTTPMKTKTKNTRTKILPTQVIKWTENTGRETQDSLLVAIFDRGNTEATSNFLILYNISLRLMILTSNKRSQPSSILSGDFKILEIKAKQLF